MMSSIQNRDGRYFVIFHPSDFSTASEVAFGHALKIALQAKAKLDIMHVQAHLRPEKAYWLDSQQCELPWHAGVSCLTAFDRKKSSKPAFV